jgi:hemoglobin
MKDIESYEDIKVMIDEFYRRVQKDDLIGPVFIAKIPGDWQPHLNIMYDFWYTVLFAKAAYRGQPFIKHATLPIYKEHFDRWIALFHQTIAELYSGNVADDAKLRAVKMSQLFQEKLKEIRSGNSKPLF